MEDSLLSHIADNFVSQYENVANSSISYLLNKYQATQAILRNILGLEEVPNNYITELTTKTNGRPDVTGLDANGNTVIIIEGKFWANLTENQPVNYLKELGDRGKLLFLAPDKRLKSLRIETLRRIGHEDNRVFFYSWMDFLTLIETENNKNYNNNLASDLFQLKNLCSKMDEEGMPPLSLTDLDPMNGRISYQFANLLDECNVIIRMWDESDFTGFKSQAFKSGYGFYFKAFGFGCLLHFSSYDWFMKKSHTPFWLNVLDESFKKSDKIYNGLNNYDSANSYNEKDKAMYAIMLQPGLDKNQVVDDIVK